MDGQSGLGDLDNLMLELGESLNLFSLFVLLKFDTDTCTCSLYKLHKSTGCLCILYFIDLCKIMISLY